MGVLTTTAVVPPPVTDFFDRLLLVRALPELVHARVATRRSLRQRSGNTIVFRRIEALPLATTPLLEGQPPAGRQLSKSDYVATIQQWGDYVTLTDMMKATIQHPVLRDANKVLGEQAGQTVDVLARDVWIAGSSAFYGGAQTARTNLTTTTHCVDGGDGSTALLDRMIRYLRQQNARKFTRMISASEDQATFPIWPAYWSITTPEVQFTLEQMPGFVPVAQYAARGGVLESEVGSYKELRFLTSTLAKSWLDGGGTASGDVRSNGGSLADVHSLLCVARDACAVVPLEGLSLKNVIKPPGSAGTADPLNQICTSGWIHAGQRKRLNESFITRGEVTARKDRPTGA